MILLKLIFLLKFQRIVPLRLNFVNNVTRAIIVGQNNLQTTQQLPNLLPSYKE